MASKPPGRTSAGMAPSVSRWPPLGNCVTTPDIGLVAVTTTPASSFASKRRAPTVTESPTSTATLLTVAARSIEIGTRPSGVATPSRTTTPRTGVAKSAKCAVVDLGPGQRDGAARAVHDRYRPPDLHLRSTQPVAARHEREHERPPTPVLPKGHQPRRGQPGRTRRRRRRTERPPSTNPRLVVTL